jgi:hypothetical protein
LKKHRLLSKLNMSSILKNSSKNYNLPHKRTITRWERTFCIVLPQSGGKRHVSWNLVPGQDPGRGHTAPSRLSWWIGSGPDKSQKSHLPSQINWKIRTIKKILKLLYNFRKINLLSISLILHLSIVSLKKL